MKKLIVEGLLLLRDIAQATAGNGALRHQVRMYLCERDVAGIDAFAYSSHSARADSYFLYA